MTFCWSMRHLKFVDGISTTISNVIKNRIKLFVIWIRNRNCCSNHIRYISIRPCLFFWRDMDDPRLTFRSFLRKKYIELCYSLSLYCASWKTKARQSSSIVVNRLRNGNIMKKKKKKTEIDHL